MLDCRIHQCQIGYVFRYVAGLNYESQPENEVLENRGFEQLKAIKDNDHIIEAVQDSIENQELQTPV